MAKISNWIVIDMTTIQIKLPYGKWVDYIKDVPEAEADLIVADMKENFVKIVDVRKVD